MIDVMSADYDENILAEWMMLSSVHVTMMIFNELVRLMMKLMPLDAQVLLHHPHTAGRADWTSERNDISFLSINKKVL